MTVKRLDKAEASVWREVRYIRRRAAAGDSRVVSFGELVFFSSCGGDTWILDPRDSLALCLARARDPLEVNIKESADRFAVEWTHSYVIQGALMTFADRFGRVTSVQGYPAGEISRAARRVLEGPI